MAEFKGKHVEVVNGVCSTLRKATKKELSEAEKVFHAITKLRNEIKALEEARRLLENRCKHTVIYDEWGYIYDERYCAGCGKFMGLI